MFRAYCTYVDGSGDNNTATFKGKTPRGAEEEMDRFIVEGQFQRQHYTTILYMQNFAELQKEIDQRLDKNHRIVLSDMPYYRLYCFKDLDAGDVFGMKQTDLNKWDRQHPGSVGYVQYLRSPEGRQRLAGVTNTTPQVRVRDFDQPQSGVRIILHPFHNCWVVQVGQHSIDVFDILKWVKANHPEWWDQN